jgi:dipeptidyl aminopeptidase/acylaminoacyl peptidase
MWGATNPTIWHEVQFFAARGYGVVFANPRGSSGYGYKFQRASFQNWATGPAGDVLAAADAVAKEPWVDADRQVISGGSYGAYLTAWILATDTRFKAAVAARGVYDLTTFFGEGDAWPLVPWHFGGQPWEPETRKLLDAQSPLTRVDSIRTPLLIKQNDDDTRTGTAQGELLYRSLKLLGRPVELVSYPHATHELSRTGDPVQRIDRLVRFDEFFQRFIGTPAQPIPPPPPTPPPPPAPATATPAPVKP